MWASVILYVTRRWERSVAPVEGLELGLSKGFRLSAMASYAVTVNRYGIWGRSIAALVMVFAAGLLASPAWRAVQLLPLAAGVVLAWTGAYMTVDTEARRGAIRRWLAAHAVDRDTAANANLPGLLEGSGAVAGALLFAGPLPVSMALGVRVVALVVLTAYAWNAFSQVATDPGYYSADAAPARWTVAARWLLPPAAAATALVIFRWPMATKPATAPVPWWTAILLASSFLLIWLYTGTLNLLLRCATVSADAEVIRNLGAQERIHYEYVHRAKNELRPDFRGISSDNAEYLAYSAAVVTVDNAIRDIKAYAAGNRDDAHPVAELWHRYRATISGIAVRDRLRLADFTASRKLSHMEGLILQSIFVGLVSNALRASPAHPVTVTVSNGMNDKDMRTVRVVVEDDGTGGAPSTFERGSGLAHLHDLCSLYKGGVCITGRDGGGTRAIATFSFPRLVSAAGDTNNPAQEEISDGHFPDTGGRRRTGIHIGRRRLAPPGT
jgi:hypothetical protein